MFLSNEGSLDEAKHACNRKQQKGKQCCDLKSRHNILGTHA